MYKIIMIFIASLMMTGCVMFKANSDGVWVGMTWTDAGSAVSKVLPQKIDDKLQEYIPYESNEEFDQD